MGLYSTTVVMWGLDPIQEIPSVSFIIIPLKGHPGVQS